MYVDNIKILRSKTMSPSRSFTDRRPTKLGELVKRLFWRKTLAYLQKLEKCAKSYS